MKIFLTSLDLLDILSILSVNLWIKDHWNFKTFEWYFYFCIIFSGNLRRDPIRYPFLNRHKLWEGEDICHGKFLRGICIFSMQDVVNMTDVNNKKLFANKFVLGMNTEVYNYMENWFYHRSRIVYSNTNINPFINLTYYSQLTVVENHYD